MSCVREKTARWGLQTAECRPPPLPFDFAAAQFGEAALTEAVDLVREMEGHEITVVF